MTNLTPPDVVRGAYLELVVSDLAESRAFYVDVLGLVVTAEDENAIYLRTLEEVHPSQSGAAAGPVPAAAALAFRVRTPADVDRAEAYYRELGCRTEREPAASSTASAMRCGWSTRSDSPTSSSSR
jgi:Glyoxalase/Bleomycin resistance protein/Dioxygenase superfamily.